MSRIVVVGSINLDLVAQVQRLPHPGETIRGRRLEYIPGGKGANQAVAAARLGAEAILLGRLGDDPFAIRLRESLQAAGVDTRLVHDTADCGSGVALICVDASGQNSITIIPGANDRLAPEDVHRAADVISAADVLLLQLEVPLETVVAAIQLAAVHGVLSVLDPAPAPPQEWPLELLAADVVSPNQTEAECLTGLPVTTVAEAQAAAAALRERGAGRVVIKLGALGALAADEDGNFFHVPAAEVGQVVDTTAAGDAFTAALGWGLAQGWRLERATRWACAAGSLATTRWGAQPAMPRAAEVAELFGPQS